MKLFVFLGGYQQPSRLSDVFADAVSRFSCNLLFSKKCLNENTKCILLKFIAKLTTTEMFTNLYPLP